MKNAYTIIEISIIIIFLSIVLSLTMNIKLSQDKKNIKVIINEINHYTSIIKSFKNIYGFLPGDLDKTQVFNLSKTNTDGNKNNIIEDDLQLKNKDSKRIKATGEVVNMWLHLYNAKFLKKNTDIFPHIDLLKTGILIFSYGYDNYYHLSVSGVNKNLDIETKNNLTPQQAYLLDQKMDDGAPYSGIINATGGKYIYRDIRKAHNKCATHYEYLTVFRQKLCQLVIKLQI